MLAIESLTAGYGAHDEILKGVGLRADAGEMVALIGPNGAGKSTLLKAVVGIVAARAGAIRFDGQALAGLKPREISRRGIAFVPQEGNVFPSLSVEENLEIGGYVDRAARRGRIQAIYARLPMLAERRRQAAGTLSGGQRQTLAMGMALMVAPKMLLLDEPSAGLSPMAAGELFGLIKSLHRDGMTVVMVEQNALEALAVADRAYLLVDGRNARDGAARALAEDPEIRHAFLGG
ncbi:MAG: ABC transporter ATP-binding protein [Alphaproteobacteria bacterium]|nr:ABC transporter ATP-binding protein [Alphaproteobacteria bacterium]